MTKRFNTAKYAMGVLKREMIHTENYAWVWHCNLVSASHMGGADLAEANRVAARFMRNTFGVDTSKHEAYAQTQED